MVAFAFPPFSVVPNVRLLAHTAMSRGFSSVCVCVSEGCVCLLEEVLAYWEKPPRAAIDIVDKRDIMEEFGL